MATLAEILQSEECDRTAITALQAFGTKYKVNFVEVFDCVDCILVDTYDCDRAICNNFERVTHAAGKLQDIIVHLVPANSRLSAKQHMTWQLMRGTAGVWDILRGRCTSNYLEQFVRDPLMTFLDHHGWLDDD